MRRVWWLAAILLMTVAAQSVPARGVLRVKVVLASPARGAVPVPRYVLLISDNPATAPPRRVTTTLDGSIEVQLLPGNYTVESDRPLAFEGKSYQWTQMLDIIGGQEAVLELTLDNADATDDAAAPLGLHASSVLARWHESVVAVWTPTMRASGFVIDARGSIATAARAIGAAKTVEVQLTPSLKVAGDVIVVDRERDVALVRIAPAVLGARPHVPLACGDAAASAIARGEEIVSVESPIDAEKGTIGGTVRRVTTNVIESDLVPAVGGTGAPVFTLEGRLVGIASVIDDRTAPGRAEARIVRVGLMCDVVSGVTAKLDAAPPSAAPLPVEPTRRFPADVLKNALERRVGSLNPYLMETADFDIAFMTPVQVHAALEHATQLGRVSSGGPGANIEQALRDHMTDFVNWADYVEMVPSVLLVRVTPKLVEGFWTKVARGAAQTQGVGIPAIKKLKATFSSLRISCGTAPVTPIHPFRLEEHVTERDTIVEGLYVFDPSAISPSCGTVTLQVASEKSPKGESVTVDPKTVARIWEDFAPYRERQP